MSAPPAISEDAILRWQRSDRRDLQRYEARAQFSGSVDRYDRDVKSIPVERRSLARCAHVI